MNSRGFTIIEMIVALVILTFGILGFGVSAGYMLGISADAGVRAEALQAVEGRMSQIVSDPRYGSLESLYEGTQTNLPGLEGCSMKTSIKQTKTTKNGRITDYKTVTIRIVGPGLSEAVSRTMIVGAP